MDLSLRHIEIFRAVMTAGSVTGAARLLFTSQPTVSRELARFEHLLGFRLFDREGGRLSPTAQGLALFDEVQRAYTGLERIAGAAQAIRRYDQGQLAITGLPVFAQTLLPAFAQALQERHPGVSLSIAAQESPLLEESLSGQRHDLGLLETELVPRGTQGSTLLAADMVCILPAGHRLLQKPVLDLADFHDQPFISLSGLDIYRQSLDTHFVTAGVQRRLVVETSTAASVCAMVRQGLGLAIVNPLSALDEAGRGLEMRRLAVSVPFRVQLIRPEFRPASTLVDTAMQLFREQAEAIQQRLAHRLIGNP
ncbi:LysR family transcriptional regulator [Pseudomonas sp. JS3066]|uniref:LysR family transcriptional regulator n=1 Tax=unclassified Pseudomonas TaxID=196821 RepID=UPI000EAA1331|nr:MULTISPECIES: LysR family transcriptional regulator [unclassified Pseudomonas]AYF88101.1 LysR family transcriptional regulator [Pseudomonas sp. DY-1]WVK94325.1 LysR family transcriptional regulator [Pseudomonas sp. JS3066]